MGMTEEMAQDLVDVFDVSGHEMTLLDLLDCLSSVGLALRDDDGTDEASNLYIGILKNAIERKKAEK